MWKSVEEGSGTEADRVGSGRGGKGSASSAASERSGSDTKLLCAPARDHVLGLLMGTSFVGLKLPFLDPKGAMVAEEDIGGEEVSG